MALRVSIKPFLAGYVTDFALEELGTDDLSEAIAQIIIDHKRGKCSCSRPNSAERGGFEPVPMPSSTDSDLLAELESLPGISD